jgi:hypothetical protein
MFIEESFLTAFEVLVFLCFQNIISPEWERLQPSVISSVSKLLNGQQ